MVIFVLKAVTRLQKIFINKERPTAIFSCNNLMTLGVLKALRELNLITPRDISLIGFDEIELLDILGFKISYISRQTYEMGKIAMKILLEQIDNKNDRKEKVVKKITLIPKLTLNGSEKLINVNK